MACNCSNNPCSCANANCACPPDFTVDPATLTCQGTTCEDTISTQCIFSSGALPCVSLPSGTDLATVLLALDTKICQTVSPSGNTFQPLILFYVDSNNTGSGDGSVGNPYKTIDLAYAAVIGSGTAASPTHAGAQIFVFSGTYSTALNIYIPGSKWHFMPNATVTYTGSSYFINSSSFTDGAANFIVTGSLVFKTSTGGFLHNSGSYTNTSVNKFISIQAHKIISNTPIASSRILINHELTYGTNASLPISTYITLQDKTSSIVSSENNTVVSTGGVLYINLNEGEIGYGIDYISGGYKGINSGVVFTYINSDSTNLKYLTSQTLKNGTIWSVNNFTMLAFSGIYNYYLLENLTTVTLAPDSIDAPQYFIVFTAVTLATGGASTTNTFTLCFDHVILSPDSFSGAATDVIFNGSGSRITDLEMQNCRLYSPLSFGPIITLGNNVTGRRASPVVNIINGVPHYGPNLLQYANNSAAITGGLQAGDVYVNYTGTSKVLQIVY